MSYRTRVDKIGGDVKGSLYLVLTLAGSGVGCSGAGSSGVGSPAKTTGTNVCPQATISNQTHRFEGELSLAGLGVGFNPLTSQLANRCVVESDETAKCAGAAQREFKMQFVKQAEQLRDALSLSAFASYEGGVYSGEASASFVRERELTSDSAYLVLDVLLQHEPTKLPRARMTDDALDRLVRDKESFIANCGSEYMSSVTRGARFRAIYKFSALSETAKERLEADLRVSGANWTAGGSFSSNLQRSISRYQTELWVKQQGGAFKAVSLTPDQLIAEATAFGIPGNTCDAAYVVNLETKPYYTAENFPAGERYPDIQPHFEVLQSFAVDFDRLKIFRNDLDARIRRPGRLANLECEDDYRAILAEAKEVDALLARARAKVASCQRTPVCGVSKDCVGKIALPLLSLPRLKQPERCGPACTDSNDSTYSSDSFGYCTRCTFQWKAKATFDQAASNLFESSCRYMRPGARVAVRAAGSVSRRGDPCSGNAFFIEANVIAVSEPEQQTCDGNGPCRIYFRDQSGTKDLSAKAEIDVAGKKSPPTVTGRIDQSLAYGTGCNGVAYGALTMDICDMDRPEGCK